MKRSVRTSRAALLVLGAVVVSAITLTPKGVAADQEGVPRSKRMQELYKTLADLLTDVTSDHRFKDPANRYRIENEVNKLAVLAHDLNKKGMATIDPDPTLSLVAGLLAQETKRAAQELKRGNLAYARNILRTVPTYCIACHTRNATGPQFSELPFEPSSKTLTLLERGEFFAATRQFDRAQQEFMKIIQDPKSATAFNFDWEKAIHQSLAIAVRVKQDPVQTQEIVDTVLNMKRAPSSVKEDAKMWKASVEDWKAEPPHQAITEEGLNLEAVRLMAKARETQKYPMDRTADIFYLRASAAAHDLLQAAPNGNHVDEALLIAGLSYEVLSPLKTEDLHDLYYEACIRKAPHSSTSDLCYRRYEQSIFFGFTGSSGTEIPEDLREKLLELRALSQPAAPVIQ